MQALVSCSQSVSSYTLSIELPSEQLRKGGWGGSFYFSQAVNGNNLSTFSGSLVNAVNDFDLDG
jgi:hypothetical protein